MQKNILGGGSSGVRSGSLINFRSEVRILPALLNFDNLTLSVVWHSGNAMGCNPVPLHGAKRFDSSTTDSSIVGIMLDCAHKTDLRPGNYA